MVVEDDSDGPARGGMDTLLGARELWLNATQRERVAKIVGQGEPGGNDRHLLVILALTKPYHVSSSWPLIIEGDGSPAASKAR